MGDANTRKLEDKIRFLQKEAEAYKRQSYDQADLLLDLVPPLSRLGHAAAPDVVDAALELARGISKNSQDIDTIREVADAFLAIYKKANDAGDLQPHDIGWRKLLVSATADLPLDRKALKDFSQLLLNGESLNNALEPLKDALQQSGDNSGLDASTCERLAEMIAALPLEKLELLQAGKLSSRLRHDSLTMDDLQQILEELASLLGHALQSTQKRDQQMQRLVAQMSGELSVVEGFLGALNQRDDASLAEAVTVQAEISEQSLGIAAVFDSNDSLVDVKKQVLSRAASIRTRMDRYAADAQIQRESAAHDTAELAGRLAAVETELQNTREELEEAKETASTDFLTGLHNRLAFEQSMGQWLKAAQPNEQLCCIIWDVDYFKKVNDTYGHVVGDRVLRAVSAILKDRVGDDDMAARLGGEEFVTVIRHSDPQAVLQWADGVREEIASTQHDADTEMIAVSVSCGIAQYQRSDTLVSILARADKMLYSAKDQGRNRCLLAA